MCYSCDLWSAKHKQWFSRRLTQACLGHQTAQATRLTRLVSTHWLNCHQEWRLDQPMAPSVVSMFGECVRSKGATA